MMDQDEYGEVITTDTTIRELAWLLVGPSVVIGWTDGEGSHLDILFCYRAKQFGHLQRGMQSDDLFVAVSGFGMFGFKVDELPLYGSYVGEKLGLGDNITSTKLAELIGGVRKILRE